MADEDLTSPRYLREKMSAEDRERYDNDMIMFGRAVLRELQSGDVVYVPPAEWPHGLSKTTRKR